MTRYRNQVGALACTVLLALAGCSGSSGTDGGSHDGAMQGGDEDLSMSSAGLCGNGALNAGEQCDDGNTVAGDGCSAHLHRRVGLHLPDAGRALHARHVARLWQRRARHRRGLRRRQHRERRRLLVVVLARAGLHLHDGGHAVHQRSLLRRRHPAAAGRVRRRQRHPRRRLLRHLPPRAQLRLLDPDARAFAAARGSASRRSSAATASSPATRRATTATP